MNHPLGIIAGQSNDDYHAAPGVSNSGLSLILRSPAHYYARYLDPNREPPTQTPAMAAGTALHCAILEPQSFSLRYAAKPEGIDRRTTAGKAAYAEFEARIASRIVIDGEDYDSYRRCADAAHRHPTIRYIIGKGAAEQSVFAKHPGTGLLVKCRPDYLAMDGDARIHLSLKTTEDARADAFQRTAWNLGYHRADAFYHDVLAWAGAPADATFVVAIERSAPYAVAVYEPDAGFISMGRDQYERALAVYATCLETDEWPGYDPAIVPLSLPAWAK